MFLEFDWTFGCFRPRFGKGFTGIRGVTFYATLKEAKAHLAACGLKLGKKTDTRTWEIVDAD
jgi:hypothetical protein